MSGEESCIDLTHSREASPNPRSRRRRIGSSATIDISSPTEDEVGLSDVVEQARTDEDEAEPGNIQPGSSVQVQRSGADAKPGFAESGRGIGKRKRGSEAERARHTAEVTKQRAQARRAEARAQRELARANKKANEQLEKHAQQKRVDEFGNTVRYSSTPAQQTRERMARAMPSTHSLSCLPLAE